MLPRFWGEPFMAQRNARDVSRFILRVQKNSALLPHLLELRRNASANTQKRERAAFGSPCVL